MPGRGGAAATEVTALAAIVGGRGWEGWDKGTGRETGEVGGRVRGERMRGGEGGRGKGAGEWGEEAAALYAPASQWAHYALWNTAQRHDKAGRRVCYGGVRRPSSTSTAAEQIFKRDPGENHVDVRLDNTWCHFCAGPPAESWKTAAKHADYLQLGFCHWSGASVVTSPMTSPFSLQRPHFCSSNESYGMSMSARARTRLSANGTLLPLAPLPSRRSRDSRTRQSNVLVLAAAGVATRQGRQELLVLAPRRFNPNLHPPHPWSCSAVHPPRPSGACSPVCQCPLPPRPGRGSHGHQPRPARRGAARGGGTVLAPLLDHAAVETKEGRGGRPLGALFLRRQHCKRTPPPPFAKGPQRGRRYRSDG